ncbi:unnamed protein product [Paramecium pentaurelia]|uniref:Uncharacterized protein n=1 Tax=Paramecium pentaurelia TaxID=43138 RepID=A0A8S1UJM3_9CILI|nr:unnamed protein product [Paramecium pentaurelia]
MNLNGAQLLNCKWKNLKIHELNRLDGLDGPVSSVCFSPDRNTLASDSRDTSICLRDIKNKYFSDYRFKEIQVKNTRYPFFNTPLQYIQQYGLPKLQFFKVQENFFKKTVSFQENYWSST